MKSILCWTKIVTILFISNIAFTACSLDDSLEVALPNVEIQEIFGNYFGQMTTQQEHRQYMRPATFKVQENQIVFDNLNVEEIIASIESSDLTGKPIELQSKVAYDLDFQANLNETKTAVVLSFIPVDLFFEVLQGGEYKRVEVEIEANVKGVYQGLSRTISFEFKVKNILFDGTEITPFELISYSFPTFVKR
ncbi:DUF4840 domain-containing protein [Myroides injenensis]|uniref:DUF4840 domain-containing protein n=1 Tax=Myroides injenensis TaxID=1183151 RepID=UPI000287A89B|nr:DUF4840 domain-containing protein [Myroides injenensis]